MKKYLFVLFVIGIIFRFWIANLVPQPFVFDQTEYHFYALQMLHKGLVAWQPRLYGYPLFLSLIYKLFGEGNFLVVFVAQSIVDTLTGLIIYLIAKKIFKNQKVAIFSYILYLFNPFTSVYAILTLSEVWGVFLVAVIFYLMILIYKRGDASGGPPIRAAARQSNSEHEVGVTRGRTPWFLLLTLILGYLPQVRPAFLFYSLFLFGIISIWFYKNYKLRRGVLIAVLLFILPFIYNIAGNWVYFKQFSPTTVDNLLVREFFISLYVPGRAPIHARDPLSFPMEVQKIYYEYTPIPQTPLDRKFMTRKYLYLALKKVEANPGEFILSRIRKFWYVWEKHFIFYYNQPANTLIDFLTYWGNNILIFLAIYGFYIWFRKEVKLKMRWFGHFTIFTIFYISAVHSFSLTEERYSFPGYPLLFLFAGYGIWNIIRKLYDSRF